MYKKILLNVKSKLAGIFAIIMTLCFGFAAIGCVYRFETERDYIVRVIKEEYDVEKILWLEPAVNCNTISGIDYYSPSGNVHHKESLFSITYSGWYVLGIDDRGYETFVLVPLKRDSQVKPRVYQWPFAYTFTEIANFAAEYGYKYVDGIGDMKDYLGDENGALHVLDAKYSQHSPKSRYIDVFTELFEDPDKKYDELDVKFVFYLFGYADDTIHYITQESGKLLMYEAIETDTETNINVIASYERDKQDAQT